jgi:hypothetical protein
MAREDPLEVEGEELLHRARLLGPRVPAHLPARLQGLAVVAAPDVVAREEQGVAKEKRHAPAGVTGDGDGEQVGAERRDRRLRYAPTRPIVPRCTGTSAEVLAERAPRLADRTRKAITFHDLRATGITWCAVRGDDRLNIKQRARHSTFSTTEGYIREAENLGEGLGAVFPGLPPSLLGESAKRATNGPSDPIGDEKVNEISGGAGNRTRESGTRAGRARLG